MAAVLPPWMDDHDERAMAYLADNEDGPVRSSGGNDTEENSR